MLEIDFTDLSQMREIMDKYGDEEYGQLGEDEQGNPAVIGIYHDRIAVTSSLDYGTSTAIYYRNGEVDHYYEED